MYIYIYIFYSSDLIYSYTEADVNFQSKNYEIILSRLYINVHVNIIIFLGYIRTDSHINL